MTDVSHTAGAVLAGGASRRMGTDKALIDMGGRPLIERSIDALRGAGVKEIVIVGGEGGWFASSGHRHVEDRWPGAGPLGGIVTALGSVDADVVVILACDLIAPTAEVVRRVATELEGHDVCVPVSEGEPQWLHAAWRRSGEPALAAAFETGVRAPKNALAGLNVHRVAIEEPKSFHDADRPEDLPAS